MCAALEELQNCMSFIPEWMQRHAQQRAGLEERRVEIPVLGTRRREAVICVAAMIARSLNGEGE